MSSKRVHHCALIGTGSLLIQAAEELAARGHAILAIATPDPSVATWCREQKITVAHDWAGLVTALGDRTIDLLFSVVNNEVLPSNALSMPQLMAINYHDAPLPRYAGIHATSWALMAGETEHGVTWHVMSDRVDFGDILEQECFSVAPDDNALTLNAKCYAAAQRAFRTLLTKLERDDLTRRPQSEADRSFFSRHKRPADAGILDFGHAAQALVDLGRALDFGVYENPLGTTRIWTGDRLLIASSVILAESGPHALPGTIINNGSDWLRVAAADGTRDVRVLGLREIDGSPTNLAQPRFAVARTLMSPEPGELAELVRADEASHRHEQAWASRLATITPIALPLLPGQATDEDGDLEVDLGTHTDAPALFAAYLARTSRMESFDLLLSTPAFGRGIAATLVESHVPISIESEEADALGPFIERVRTAITSAEDMGAYARDVAVRFPNLRDIPELRRSADWHAAIEIDPPADAELRAAVTLRVRTGGAVSLAFRRNLVPGATARAIADQFGVMLQSAANAETIGALDFTPAAERTRVLDTFNDTAAPYESAIRLTDLIRRRVELHPDAIALRFEGQSISYAELDAAAWQIARRLRTMGVEPGVLVGVCVDRSVELVTSLLGILYAGGAYVPLDPAYPPDRIAAMVEDARMLAVLSRAGELERVGAAFTARDVPVIRLDDGSLDSESTAPLELVATEDDPAYVIFTSGSTGRPKGAANCHRAIINRLLWMQDYYQLTPDDRVMQKTPSSFDVSVWEFFWPLITGATLVVARPDGHRDPAYIAQLIRDEGVSVMHFVPSMLRAFLEERDLETCTTLRRVVCSGEALPPDLVERFFTRLSSAKLANLYGPTEAAVDVTAWECEPGMTLVPIGRPVANTRMYVLDTNLRPLPVGVPGEIFIGGVQVGLGYVNRDELTRERFLDDPHHAGGRIYRTGDLGRWLPDGSLEYLGRLDDQVKIRGLRIELGEIEQVLAQQPDVRDAVVIAREDVPGSQRIVAYVVGDADTGDLREALARVLPDYMVPSAFVTLGELPVTPNGKLNRKALPAPPRGSQRDEAEAGSEPASETERTLAAIFAEVLRLDHVSPNDNFFEIGGDSILSIQICAKARSQDILITPNQLFDFPTIAELAPNAKLSAAARIDQGPVTGDAPLIPIQQWLLDQPLTRADHWNAAIMLDIPADATPDSIAASLEAIVRHHDALRLRFTRTSAGWTSHHAPVDDAPVPVRTVEVDAFDTPETDEQVRVEGGALQASLDLESGPCFGAIVFRTRDGSASRLLMVAHHLVLDGMSWRIVVEDLIAAHARVRSGEQPELPAKTMSFASWGRMLESHAGSTTIADEAPWWRDALAVEPAAPAGNDDGVNDEKSARVHTVQLEEETTRSLLHDAPGVHRAQMNDLLLTALAVTLRDAGSPSRLRIDMMGHGREQIPGADVEVSRTVGWFTTLFPVAIDVGDGDVAAAVPAVRDHLRSIPARGLGFGLLRWVRSEMSEAAPSRISFNYLGQFDQALEPGWSLGVARTHCGATRDPESPRHYDLEVDVMVVGGRMVIDWTYSANRHDAAVIADLAESYRRALATIASPQSATASTAAEMFPLAGLNEDGLAKLSALFDTTDT